MQDKIKIVDLISINDNNVIVSFDDTITMGYNPTLLFKSNKRLIYIK